MARYSGSPFGKISGKLGESVGASWKGIKVVRVYQPVVGNPRTFAQQMQRARFRALSALGKAFGAILKLGFRNHTQSLTASNLFMSRNKGATTGATPEDIEAVPEDIVISDGDLRPIAGLAATGNTGTSLDLAWTQNLGGDAQGTDYLAVSIWNRTEDVVYSSEIDFTRADQAGTLNGIVLNPGDELEIYTFTHNAITGKVSSTVHHSYVAV